jgi:hypothetical protein
MGDTFRHDTSMSKPFPSILCITFKSTYTRIMVWNALYKKTIQNQHLSKAAGHVSDYPGIALAALAMAIYCF